MDWTTRFFLLAFQNVDGIAPAPRRASSPNLLDIDQRIEFAVRTVSCRGQRDQAGETITLNQQQ